MNVALHGLETAIPTAVPVFNGSRRWQPRVIRYADDLVVFHRDYDAIVQAQDIASRWLQEMGLALKPSKTRIGHTLHPVEGTTGFAFLSFNIRQYPVGQTKTGKTGQGQPLGFKTLIRPSQTGQRRHVQKMHEEVRRLRAASQEVLIKRLNSIIRGWSNYYATVASKKTFVSMDNALLIQHKREAEQHASVASTPPLALVPSNQGPTPPTQTPDEQLSLEDGADSVPQWPFVDAEAA
jgi:RNA-directed DNA polymerase